MIKENFKKISAFLLTICLIINNFVVAYPIYAQSQENMDVLIKVFFLNGSYEEYNLNVTDGQTIGNLKSYVSVQTKIPSGDIKMLNSKSEEYLDDNFNFYGTETEFRAVETHKLQFHEAQEPTCLNQGISAYYVCVNCGKMFSDENGKVEIQQPNTTPPIPHQMQYHSEVPASCTSSGTKEYWQCSICSQKYSDANGNQLTNDAALTIDALGHSFGEYIVEKEATCTEDGLQYKECSLCHYKEYSTIKATGHSVEHHEYLAPTTEFDGHEEYWECSICHQLWLDDNQTQPTDTIPVIPKLQVGDMQSVNIYVSGCGIENKNYEVTIYSNETKDTFISKIKSVANIDNFDGYKVSFVTSIGEFDIDEYEFVFSNSISSVNIEKQHVLTHHPKVEATLINGTEEYWECNSCHKLFSDAFGKDEILSPVEIPAISNIKFLIQDEKENTETAVLNIPTTYEDIENIVKNYLEEKYNNEQTSGYIVPEELNNHISIVILNNSGTEYSDKETLLSNYDTFENAILDTKEIKITFNSHIYKFVPEIAATCSKEGTKEHYECVLCNKIFSEKNENSIVDISNLIIQKIPHSFGEWVITKEATCSETGLKERTCNVCNERETQEIQMTNHALKLVEATEANCQHNGNIQYQICSSCGEYFNMNGDKIDKESVIIPQTEHHFGEWNIRTNSTCIQKGLEYRVCEYCNFEETREIDFAEHNLTHYDIVNATCTENGMKAYDKCSVCNKMFIDNQEVQENNLLINALGHNWGEYEVTIEPTCILEGEETAHCTRCDATNTRRIPKAEHNYGEWIITKEATCLETGVKKAICQTPGCDAYKEETIPVISHNTTTISEVPASCTENGVKEHEHCSICNHDFIDGKMVTSDAELIIPALGHDFGEYETTTPSTCTIAGSETAYCSRCDATDTRPLPLDSHHLEFRKIIKNATCVEHGIEEYGCINCDYTEERETSLADHNYVLVSEKPSTCQKNGIASHYECSVCNKVFTLDKIETTMDSLSLPLAEHTITSIPEVPSTCVINGTAAYDICNVCNKMFKQGTNEEITKEDLILPLVAHKYELTEVKEATCTEEGRNTLVCSVCNDTQYQTIEKKEHNYQKVEKIDETCTTNGMKEHFICTSCSNLFVLENNSYKQVEEADIVIKAQHVKEYNEGKEATCTEDGYEAYYFCNRCGKLFSDEDMKNEIKKPIAIQSKGHNLVKHDKEESTCTQEGHEAYSQCSNCGKLFNYEGTSEIENIISIPKISHTLKFYDKKDSSCSNEGYEAYYKCEKCGKYFSDKDAKNEISSPVIIAKKSHNMGEWIIDKNPTETETGSRHRDCKNCDYRETETLAKLPSNNNSSATQNTTQTQTSNQIASNPKPNKVTNPIKPNDNKVESTITTEKPNIEETQNETNQNQVISDNVNSESQETTEDTVSNITQENKNSSNIIFVIIGVVCAVAIISIGVFIFLKNKNY